MINLKSNQRLPRIAMLAPLGWCVRDWLSSDFFQVLSLKSEIIIFSPQAEILRKHFKLPRVSFKQMEVRPLVGIRHNLAAFFQLVHYYKIQTYIHANMLSRLGYGWPWASRLRIEVIKGSIRYIFKRFPIQWFEWARRAFLGLMRESRRLERLLRDLNVKLVFSTMPLIAHYELPALWAAQRLGVPTACILTSWDNLSSKGRLPINFSHYMVWSQFMRDDLLAHYPDIPSRAITVVGAPQFDLYRKKDLLRDREGFIRSIGGDPSKKLILWSSASLNQMPNEPKVFEQFCEAVRSGKLIGQTQILLRPHPIGGGARFAEVYKRYPEILFTETNYTDPRYLIHWMPTLGDLELLVNSIVHCNVNINHASTMTLDCCVLDRPVVNIAFDIEKDSDIERYVRNCYFYEHYRSVLELGAVRMAYSLDQLITQVNEYLKDSTLDQEGRMKLLKLQCGEVDGKAAQRAAECLLAISK